jgi:hypothetical protein
MEPDNIQRLKDMIDTHFKKINDLISIINTIQITQEQMQLQEQIIPSIPVESEIVIVCNCSPKNDKQLYYIKDNKIINKIGDDVKYVYEKTICKDDKWSNVKNGSKMYIWGTNCSINYSHLKNVKYIPPIINILDNSFLKLKKNGKVFFPVFFKNGKIDWTQNQKTLNRFFEENKFNGFTFTLEPIDKFPYIIDKEIYTDRIIKYFYVFTKN